MGKPTEKKPKVEQVSIEEQFGRKVVTFIPDITRPWWKIKVGLDSADEGGGVFLRAWGAITITPASSNEIHIQPRTELD